MKADPCVSSPERWRESASYRRGVEHFNARKFWEAHEAWEEIWLECEGVQAEFLQGLIQSAAALLKYQRGELPPAQRLFDAAMKRLSACPDVYMGLNVPTFQRQMRDCFALLKAASAEQPDAVALPRIALQNEADKG